MSKKMIVLIIFICFAIVAIISEIYEYQMRLELEQKEQITIVLNDDFESLDQNKIVENFKKVFNEQVKQEKYPNIEFKVKVMDNEAAIKYVNEHEDTLAFVDSVDYIAAEFLGESSNSHITGLIKTFGYDEDYHILYNKLEDTRTVRVEYSVENNPEFMSLSFPEIVNLKKDSIKIGVSKGKYDATRVWLYNYLVNNDIDFNQVKVVEYENEDDGRKKLKQNEVQLLLNDYIPYFNEKKINSTVSGTGEGNTIQPLNQFIIINDKLSKLEEEFIVDILTGIYQNATKIELLNSAYGAADVAKVESLKSLEEQRKLRTGIQDYINYLQGLEETNED